MTWTNTQAAATILGVSRRTIYNLITQGYLQTKHSKNGVMVFIDEQVKEILNRRKKRGFES